MKVDTLGELYYDGTLSSWTSAKTKCESMDYRLVELLNDQQYRQVITEIVYFCIFTLMQAYFLQFVAWVKDDAWIGLSDRKSEGQWVWESGNPFSSEIATHWNEGQPNNRNGREDCALIAVANSGMNDAPCEREKKFVCQKSGMFVAICEQHQSVNSSELKKLEQLE